MSILTGVTSNLDNVEKVARELKELIGGGKCSLDLQHLLGEALQYYVGEMLVLCDVRSPALLEEHVHELETLMDQAFLDVLRRPLLRQRTVLRLHIHQLEKPSQNRDIKANKRNTVERDDLQLSNALNSLSLKDFVSVKNKVIRTIVDVTYHGLDESDSFMIVSVNIPGLLPTHTKLVSCDFYKSSFHLEVEHPIDPKIFSLHVRELVRRIQPEKSVFSTIKDQVLVMLYKETVGEEWAFLTAEEGAEAERVVTERYDVLDPCGMACYRIRKSLPSNGPCCRLSGYKMYLKYGYYLVTDAGSAVLALFQFYSVEPNVVAIELTDALVRNSVWATFVSVLTTYSCYVSLYCKESFLKPRQIDNDRAALIALMNGRCKLFFVYGYFSASTIASLPMDVMHLGMAIKTSEDALMVAKTYFKKTIENLQINICKGMLSENLQRLPERIREIPVVLSFEGVSDEDIKWVVDCKVALLARRSCRLVFIYCKLSEMGVLALYSATKAMNVCEINICSKDFSDDVIKSFTVLYKKSRCEVHWSWNSTFHAKW